MSTNKLTPLQAEQEKVLINFFRDNPSLWDTKNKDYNNRSMRVEKLERLGRTLNLNRKDVYEKYRNLRTTFFRENKRVSNSIDPRSGTPTFLSKWRHYNNMIFLVSKENGTNGFNTSNGGNSSGSVKDDDSIQSDGTGIGGSGQHTPVMAMMNNSNQLVMHNGTTPLYVVTNGHHQQQQQINQVGPEMITLETNTESQQPHHRQVLMLPVQFKQEQANANQQATQQTINATPPSINGNASAIIHKTTNGNAFISNANANTNVQHRSVITGTASGQPQQMLHFTPGGQLVSSVAYKPTTATPSSTTQSITVRKCQNLEPVQSISGVTYKIMTQGNQILTFPVGGTTPASTFQLVTQSSQPTTTSANSVTPNTTRIINGNANSSVTTTNFLTSTPIVDHRSRIKQVSGSSISSVGSNSGVGGGSVTPILVPARSNVSGSAENSLTPVVMVTPNEYNHATFKSLPSGVVKLIPPQRPSAGPLLTNIVKHDTSAHPQPVVTNDNKCSSSSSNTYSSPTPVVAGCNATTAGDNRSPVDIREMIKGVVREMLADELADDEDMAFCRSLAPSLRSMGRSVKDVAKLELQQLIVRFTNPDYYKNRNKEATVTASVITSTGAINNGQVSFQEVTPVVAPASATIGLRSSRSSTNSLNNAAGVMKQQPPQQQGSSNPCGSTSSTIILRSRASNSASRYSTGGDTEEQQPSGSSSSNDGLNLLPACIKRTRSGQSPTKASLPPTTAGGSGGGTSYGLPTKQAKIDKAM